MKIALVCDDLIQFGGAEKIVMELCSIFPDSPLYTSVISKKWREICRSKNIKVITSFIQQLPFSVILNRYYSPFFFHLCAFHSFDLSSYDLVLSISARFAHTVITKPGTKHICYMHSPGRMFWEPFSYFEKEYTGILGMFKKLFKPILSVSLFFHRIIDYISAQKVDNFIANSKNTKMKILKYYGRESNIVYPFMDIDNLKDEVGESVNNGSRERYFLIISRLSSWKKIDYAINACEELGVYLKIVGEGSDRNRLNRLCKKYVKLMGYVSNQDRNNLIKGCQALIITQEEDFGIVPLEAMYLGKPVIAYGKGGSTETIEEGVTGVFYYSQNSDALKEVLNNFNPDNFDSNKCKQRALQFSKSKFEQKILEIINNVYY